VRNSQSRWLDFRGALHFSCRTKQFHLHAKRNELGTLSFAKRRVKV
jgi:hypothetical protein